MRILTDYEFDCDTPLEVWEEYSREKRKISERVMSCREYEMEIDKLCRRLRIGLYK